MSRDARKAAARERSFPRVSGDEPRQIGTMCPPPEFSPRERG